ncbi:hypothetical protein GCM10009678_42250 [Actinomadura kijaniata]|uniref:TetR family transcriptional regulator n=1 Tax=Actinomadura namibiensis TaxID=182080 RepID=A0A7W3LME9_ACTNM|nr:hypothetical protein [Actinomadura namibiensis]MBA8950798.1 hypothetical protein [Actinomadura namibiensis]
MAELGGGRLVVDGLAAALHARCVADLLDSLVEALESEGAAREGIGAFVRAYLAFTRDRRSEAYFIHASSHAGHLPAHAERIAAWLRPFVESGELVALPDPYTEMLVVGPVAETSRRRLAGDPAVDLETAAALLPDRLWNALRR